MVETDEIESTQPQHWNQLLIASLVFIAFELLLIGIFGDYFFTGVSSEPGVWLMVGLAASGYLLLGAFSGSWLSLFILLVPVFIAWSINSPIPDDAWGASERSSLYEMWIYMTVIYLPAWLIGRGIGAFLANR